MNKNYLSWKKFIYFIKSKYYLIAILSSLTYFFWSNFRPGFFSAVVVSIIIFDYIISNKKMSLNKMHLLVLLYVLYNILAFVISLLNGFTIGLPLTVLSNSVITIIFYFVGYYSNDMQTKKFMNSFIFAAFLLVIIGIVLYLTYPVIYDEYLRRAIFNYDVYYLYYIANPRLNSFTNSIIVGSISAMGFAYLLNLLYVKRSINRMKNIFLLLLAILLFIGAVLSLQRSSWIIIVLFTIVYVVFNLIYKKNVLRIISLIAVIIISLSFSSIYFSDFFNQIIDRLLSITSAISERNSNWGDLFNQDIFTFVFGGGLGTRSHQAIGLVDITINDGYFIKQIFEIGLLGTLIFGLIVILSLLKGSNAFMSIKWTH